MEKGDGGKTCLKMVIHVQPPKLDFVDCLLYGYKMERGIDIITFDKQLMKQLENIESL